jgi:hypothetical protein
MRRLGTCVLFMLVFLGVSQAVSAQPIRVGSIADSRFGTSYTLDGSRMVATRSKLLNPANFGPGGVVPRLITIVDGAATVGSVNAAFLANFDVFFIGYLDNANPNAFTPAELSAFQTWVNKGGTMIVTCDDAPEDAVCAAFGHPSIDGAVDPIVPTAVGALNPIFNGPFGVVTAANETGTKGYFTSTAGATVLGHDSSASQQPTVLFQAFGSGRVIFASDVDYFAFGVTAGPLITSQDDKFTGNAFAFAGSCSGTGMCLGSSRFLVTANWQTTTSSGHGTAIQLTPDTGYFWFFSSSNVEMVVKTLDGCGVNSKKWVFAGGLTNVDVTLTVKDLQTGAVKTYVNPQSTAFQPIQDTSAFSTCP